MLGGVVWAAAIIAAPPMPIMGGLISIKPREAKCYRHSPTPGALGERPQRKPNARHVLAFFQKRLRWGCTGLNDKGSA